MTTYPNFSGAPLAAQTVTGSAVPVAVRSLLRMSANMLSAAGVVAGLYLAKSAMGINLMPGPSPLHDLLYHLVR